MPFGGLLTGGLALLSGGSSVVSNIMGNSAQNRLVEQQRRERERAKRAQLAALSEMRRPEQSEATKRRIKVLEDESRATPLVEDPYFQADRATIAQGGQQALSGVQNTQRAMGTSGGFSNQGSMSDIYDRVGAQLAQLGQESKKLKDQKSQTATDLQQSYLDSQVEFDNAQARAKAAIEAGDSQAAQAAIAQAMEARQRQQENEQRLFGSITTGLASTFGSDWLGKNKTAPQANGQSGTNFASQLQMPEFGSQYASRTWRSMRRG